MNNSQLEVMIYQIADDAMLKQNRTDGTGWEWGWAELQRNWMDAAPNRFAYRCLRALFAPLRRPTNACGISAKAMPRRISYNAGCSLTATSSCL